MTIDIPDLIDKHLQAVRLGISLLGITGLVILVRSTHIVKVYRHISDIPVEAINRQWLLRGSVKSVSDDGFIKVTHQPVIFRNIFKAKDEEHLNIRLAGIQPMEGFSTYMNENVLGKSVDFSLLNKDVHVADAIVYGRRGRFSRKTCINEEVISDGIAVVQTSPDLFHSNVYNEFVQMLLKTEVKADKDGRKGVWKRPSIIQRWIKWFKW